MPSRTIRSWLIVFPSSEAKKLTTSATTATPVSAAANAIHLSCWRS